MSLNFTNDLLMLAYKETSLPQTLQLVSAIENDSEANSTFQSILAVQEQLNELQTEPSDASIDFILKYSQKRGLVLS